MHATDALDAEGPERAPQGSARAGVRVLGPPRLRGFAVQVLRGQAQVTFLPSALAGAVFCLALAAAGWEYALYALAGTAVGTATARFLGVDRDRVETGLEGFNACLTALCFAVFLGARHLSTALLAVAGCVVVTVVTAAVVRLLGTWGLPSLTLPYCLVASAMTLAAPGFRYVWHHGEGLAALPGPATGTTAVQPAELARGFFAGFAEIFFMPQWYVGALLLLGLLLADRRAAGVACLGGAVGLATAWALGAPAERIADGTSGYNSVLVALALCGVFLPARAATLAYALVGAGAASAAGPAVAALCAPSGGHTFTWPFVLTTLVFLAGAKSFPRLGGSPDPA
ncbi:urea transporter [Streptomyces huasconensis]|uniref:urea transporter n=1 Tax=Streptomyces huasconensis TaxID=1854574 RepID=UPI0036FCC535